MGPVTAELTENQFQKICHLVYGASGIKLKKGKEALVRARLVKRLRALKIPDISEYLALVESQSGSGELVSLVDVMTTNKTSFFREIEHFNYLRDIVLPELGDHRLRFWSAACSSGEEPYSLAMLLQDHLPNVSGRDVLILGTDISRQMLEKAKKAVYPENSTWESDVRPYRKYFVRLRNGESRRVQVVQEVRSLVRLAWLNLLDEWPMRGPFNVVFCRNVMIYFDRPTQQNLIDRFWQLIAPGGYLFVGHSEGLSGVDHRFEYVKPAIYRKQMPAGDPVYE
jgi:chemotaxis protein methyltransferase CheR